MCVCVCVGGGGGVRARTRLYYTSNVRAKSGLYFIIKPIIKAMIKPILYQ